MFIFVAYKQTLTHMNKRNRPFGDRRKDAIQILIQNELSDEPTRITDEVLGLVKYWNKNGVKRMDSLKASVLNNTATNMVNRKAPDDFILQMLLVDINAKCQAHSLSASKQKDRPKYECGRTRSHVWVHKNDERIFMFYI